MMTLNQERILNPTWQTQEGNLREGAAFLR